MREELNEAAVSDQRLDEEEAELLKTVYERLEIFEQECREYHDRAREARDILRLRDPKQDSPRVKEKTLQLQTLKSTFNNCVADQLQNMPEPRLLPETPEQAQIAEDLQDAVRYVVYDVNNYEKLHRRRAEDLFGPGTAITQIFWDPALNRGKGDVAIIRQPIEAFLWDTTAEDIQDARALIKVSWHPMSWYKAHYPQKYLYISPQDSQYNNVGMPDTQRQRVGSDESRAMLLEYWYRTWENGRYKINLAFCAGGALLENHKDVYDHGMYPFVIDVHSTIEGSPVGDGMVGELAPMMRYINRYARYMDVNLRMSSKARMLTRRNSGINKKDLADWDVDIIEGESVEPGLDYSWLQHAPMPASLQNMMMLFQNDLKQDSGMNSYSRGESTGGIVSGKAIMALQEAGGKISGLRTDTLQNGFRLIIEQVLWLMAQFYKEDRMICITGHGLPPRQITINAERFFGKKKGGVVPPPPYMVQVEVKIKDPVRVEAQNQMFMEAYTMAAQAQQYFPLSALFEILNIDGKDRLLPVIRQNEQTQQQLQQMQAQNEQMQAQMEQMQKENDSLRRTTNELANSMASSGGAPIQGPGSGKHVNDFDGSMQTGGANTNEALLQQARAAMTGEEPEM